MSMLLKRKMHQGGTMPTVEVTPQEAGWEYLLFRAFRLEPGESISAETGAYETGLVILGGTCSIQAGGGRFAAIGDRPDVWTQTPPYTVLMPPGIAYDVTAETHLHIAVAGAKATDRERLPVRLITPDDIRLEERGKGEPTGGSTTCCRRADPPPDCSWWRCTRPQATGPAFPAQARYRRSAARGLPRGDLLLPDQAGRGVRPPTGVHGGSYARPGGRRAQRRCRPRSARVPPRRSDARLRLLLPQRDGRSPEGVELHSRSPV